MKYVGSAGYCVQMVGAGLAIASSVFGCGILVGDTLGCEVLGVAYGGLSVLKGIHK